MLISRMATSGFSLFTFSTASRPFMASPTTVQPRRAQRSPRMPRRTSSWSSATRIRSLFVPLVICRYRHAHRCTADAGFNIKLAANELHSLVHARDANSESRGKVPIPFPKVSGNSAAFVAYPQRDLSRITVHSYLGLETSRMPLDVDEALLNRTE